MRLRLVVIAALVALAVPSVAVARPSRAHARDTARIVGTWSVRVMPNGAPPIAALLTFTPGGGVIETESDQPNTGLGAWKAISRKRFAIAFQTFVFTPTGPGGYVVVRSVATLTKNTLSGPFKFDVFDTTGKVVQSGSGTATATRFVIPQL